MDTTPHNPWTFSEVARRVSCLLGTPTAFAVAFSTVVLWSLSGPVFGFSDTWQLVINTGTTIVTFLINELQDPIVKAKAEAARTWIGAANAVAKEQGWKSWRYALIPHDAITANATLAGLVNVYS